MYRFFVAICVLFIVLTASLMGCASSSQTASESGIVRYGAGSLDDSATPSSAPPANKAATPTMMQKVKVEELLAQAKIHEADLDDKLAAFDFAAALSVYDSIADLLGNVPSAAGRLHEIRQKVDGALDAIVIEPVGNPAETVAGIAFKKDFAVRVFAQTADRKKPLPSFALTIAYPGVSADGAEAAQTESAKTLEDGTAAFAAPIPARAGKGTLVFSSSLSSRDPVLAASLAKRMESGKLSLSFPHIVSTNARTLSTTISILDFDQSGKPAGSSGVTATTLLKPLVQRGFRRIGMADFQAQLAAGDEAALIKSAKDLFRGGVQRFVFGTTRIESLEQAADGGWTCTVSANVTVWDLTLDRAVYTTALSRTELGKTEAAALDAARRKLAGEDLVDDLYYHM